MVSTKERQKLALMFERQATHLKNQQASINRLLLIVTEARAALLEISDMDGSAPDGQTTPQEYAQERARLGLAAMDRAAEAEATPQERARMALAREREESVSDSPTTEEG